MAEVTIKQEKKSLKIQIQVKLAHVNEHIDLNVNTFETINDVKAKIQREESIPINNIDLVYGGEQLDDCRTLSSYNIGNKAILYAIVPARDATRLSVYLARDERTVKLRVKAWYTMEDVKNIIESMVGVPVEKQRLYLNEKQLGNDEILEGLCIPNGQSITMCCGLLIGLIEEYKVIFGHPLTPNLELEVNETDTVEDVREQAGLCDYEVISYERMILEDRRTLAYYNIKNGDVISYRSRSIMERHRSKTYPWF